MKLKNMVLACSLAIVMAGVTGCASFANKEMPTAKSFPVASSSKEKPSVFVETRYYFGNPDSGSATERHKVERRDEVDNTLTASGLFKTISFDPVDQAAADYTLSVDTYNDGNRVAAALGGILTGLTLYIIPCKATDHFVEVVTLKDKSDKVIWTTRNKDSMTTWFGIWFLPWAGNTIAETFNQTLENQLRTALHDLAASGNLK